MNVDDTVELVTKMTFGPHDVLVVKVAPEADFRAIVENIAASRNQVPRLEGVPFLFTREDFAEIEKLDERDARKIYDVLRKRFEGGK